MPQGQGQNQQLIALANQVLTKATDLRDMALAGVGPTQLATNIASAIAIWEYHLTRIRDGVSADPAADAASALNLEPIPSP